MAIIMGYIYSINLYMCIMAIIMGYIYSINLYAMGVHRYMCSMAIIMGYINFTVSIYYEFKMSIVITKLNCCYGHLRKRYENSVSHL